MARKKKRRSRKASPASAGYTILILALFVVIVFLAASLYGLFSPRASREASARVLVLNGCGAEGVGLKTARVLRAEGFDVVDFRNADHFRYEETIIVDRTGDMAAALDLGKLLKTANVIQQIPDTPLVDVVVIIGADHGRYLNS